MLKEKLIMKRKLAAILTVIAVVFTLASCGNTEENLLPFGLQFGCSEADFLKRLEKSGYEVEIEQAISNNGFYASHAGEMTFKECAKLLPFGEIFDTEEREVVSIPERDPEESYNISKENERTDLSIKNMENVYWNITLELPSFFAYSLNQDKLLYEFNWAFLGDSLTGTVSALVNYFNAYFGFNTDTFAEGDSIVARWQTKELVVEISTMTNSGMTWHVLLCKSLEYDDVIMHGTGIGE